jgi:hypothetical protein
MMKPTTVETSQTRRLQMKMVGAKKTKESVRERSRSNGAPPAKTPRARVSFQP